MDIISSELWFVPAPSQSIGYWIHNSYGWPPHILIEFVHRSKVSIDSMGNELRGTKINHKV